MGSGFLVCELGERRQLPATCFRATGRHVRGLIPRQDAASGADVVNFEQQRLEFEQAAFDSGYSGKIGVSRQMSQFPALLELK